MSVRVVVVQNDFPRIAGQFDQRVDDAMDLAVLTCIAVADQLARVDTGAMRANKTIERGAGFREVNWNEEHSAYNEFGTIYMSPQPFARPGVEAAEPVFLAALRSAVGE